MRRIALLHVLLFSFNTVFGQQKHFADLDEALKNPLEVESLYLGHGTKYSSAKELPGELANCQNLRKIDIGWFKKLDISKLFILLGKLPELDTLEMKYCDLTEIPKEIGLLKRLKFLKLQSNYLVSISPEIKQLQQLDFLDLSSNKLRTLPSEIKDLQQLKELHLAYNELQELPEEIGELKQLRSLSTGGNIFQSFPKSMNKLQLDEFYFGGYNSVFPYFIFQMTSLKHLAIYETKLERFPETITTLDQLEELYLRSIRGFDVVDGLEKISRLKKLDKLTIEVDATKGIAAKIPELKQIHTLKITGLWGIPAYSMMQGTAKLTNLTSLSFDNYNDSLLPPEIGNLTKLRFLELEKSDIRILPEEIGKLKALEKLTLSTNWSHSLEFPEEIGELTQLEEFNCSDCKTHQLPKSIGNLAKLKKLSFPVSNLEQLPKSIGQLQNLEELNLNHNDITQLPDELYQLNALRKLGLSGNELTQLDPAIGQLIHIRELDLSGNLKLETIPESIGNLSELQSLYLDNTLIRTLPETLKDIPSLERIRICETLIDHPKALEATFGKKLDWESSCRSLERMLVNFEEKYGTESTKLITEKDTLIFKYKYYYNEPGVIDEEYSKEVSIAIPKSLFEKQKQFQLPLPEIKVEAHYASIWVFDASFKPLEGTVEVIEFSKNKAVLAINLSGKFSEKGASEKVLNKQVVYKK